jgi:hypothetical protein
MSEIEAKASRIAAANPELYLPWSFVQLLPAQAIRRDREQAAKALAAPAPASVG